jgi:hypothetical protein
MRIQIILLLIICHVAKGQEKVFGDTTIMKNIQASAAAIYESKDTTYYFLTKEKLFDDAICGTNIVAYGFNDAINRIVAFTDLNEGLLAAEYYYRNDSVLMIYKSFEFYKESSPPNQEKNFKKLPFWESRFYFSNGQLAGHKHTGRPNIANKFNGVSEIKDANKIFEYVKTQLREKTGNNK